MAPFVELRYVFTSNGVFVCKTNVGQHVVQHGATVMDQIFNRSHAVSHAGSLWPAPPRSGLAADAKIHCYPAGSRGVRVTV